MKNLPIKEKETIEAIKLSYQNKGWTRDLLMFLLSINTGIDITKLITLKVKDIKNKDYILLDSNKSIPLNDDLKTQLSKFIKGKKLKEFVFQNSFTGEKLTRHAIFYNFREVCKELGIRNLYSTISWRKTFAFHYYQKYKDLSFLQWLFNQHSLKQTLHFIDSYENINLRIKEGIKL